MTKTAKILIGVAVVLLAATIYFKTRPIYDDSSIAWGKYTQEKLNNAKRTKELDAEIKKLQTSIRDKDYQLDRKEDDIARKDGIIGGLRKERANLEDAYLLLTDCPAQRQNLLEQVSKFKDEVYTFEGKVSDLGDEIVLWRGKYNAAMGMSAAWEYKFNNEKVLRVLAEDLAGELKSDLRKAKTRGTIKSIIIGAAVGVIGYTFLKK